MAARTDLAGLRRCSVSGLDLTATECADTFLCLSNEERLAHCIGCGSSATPAPAKSAARTTRADVAALRTDLMATTAERDALARDLALAQARLAETAMQAESLRAELLRTRTLAEEEIAGLKAELIALRFPVGG